MEMRIFFPFDDDAPLFANLIITRDNAFRDITGIQVSALKIDRWRSMTLAARRKQFNNYNNPIDAVRAITYRLRLIIERIATPLAPINQLQS